MKSTTYIAPSLKAIVIRPRNIICASGDPDSGSYGGRTESLDEETPSKPLW